LKTLFIIDGKVIERLQFVELLLRPEDDRDHTNMVDTNTSGQPLTALTNQSCKPNESHSDWSVTWLPKGFISVGNRLTDQGEQALIFSDGLATLSIFIIGKDKFIPKATAQYGATAAVIAPLNDTEKKYMVVVVAEVPVATARRVADSVRAK
jgi:sigma-E factor negative regulatory protein RseB